MSYDEQHDEDFQRFGLDACRVDHRLIEERMRLADMVNERCGPLTIKSNVSATDWTWVKGPWPWEPDAN